jgi:glycosyltransferase involved in cell wall biosynthesis
MHVALDAHLLSTEASYRGAGVSNYSRQLLAAMGALATGHRFTAFVSAPDLGADENGLNGIDLHASSPFLQKPAVRILWEQTFLPVLLRSLRADLIHGLVNVLPLTGRTPGIVTVHDLSFLRLPDKFPAAKRIYLTRLCHASVGRACHVIAVSHQTAEDLQCFFQVPARKISVIPNGVGAHFTPADAGRSARFRQEKGLSEHYFLYLGTLEPRKNLGTLLCAFARWHTQAQGDERNMRLVIAGAKGWFYQEIFRQVVELGLGDSVYFPGYIADAELADWFRAAQAFVYPSLFEGFGLPVLEAMACGAPVLCSQAASLLEVAGDAALTIPAADEDGWVAGLALVAGQPGMAAELRRRSLARAQMFSWERTARATVDVYEQVYDQCFDRKA